MSSYKKLRKADVIDLWPLQLESLYLPTEKLLLRIQWSIVDALSYVNNPFLDTIDKIHIEDLYTLLSDHNYLSLLDDEDRDLLPILSHNYTILSDCLRDYNNQVVGLENVFFRRKLLRTISLS